MENPIDMDDLGVTLFQETQLGLGGIFHLERTHLFIMEYVFDWCPIEGFMQNATNVTPAL